MQASSPGVALCLDVTAITLDWIIWNLKVMAVQHYHTQGCTKLSATEYKLSKNPAIGYNDQ